MNWKRLLTRANRMWFEIGLAVVLGLVATTGVLAQPESGHTLAGHERGAMSVVTGVGTSAAMPAGPAAIRS